MFSRLRKHTTYANLALTLALVFAMTGGAFAASKYLITSTKQISPKVLAALKGRNGKPGANGAPGSAGATGAKGENGTNGTNGEKGANGTNGTNGTNGATGPAGPAGATGPKGSEGAKGAVGKEGPTGATGPQGTTGSPWPAGGTLPAGATETGLLRAHELGYEIFSFTGVVTAVSFPIKLSKAPKVTIIDSGKTGQGAGSGCPAGSSESKPEAESGFLCVFIGGEHINVGVETVAHPFEEDFALGEEAIFLGNSSPAGCYIDFVEQGQHTPVIVDGSWAVTG